MVLHPGGKRMAHLKYVCIRFHDPPTEEELRREHLNRELSADNSIYQTTNGKFYQHYFYKYFSKPAPSCFVIGIDASPGGFQIVERKTADCFFIFVIRGKGTLNGKEFHAGQFFTISPHFVTTLISDRNDPWVLCWFSWYGSFSEEIHRIYSKFPCGVCYDFQNAEALLQFFTGFLSGDHTYADSRYLIQSFAGCVLSMFDVQPLPSEQLEETAVSRRIRSYVEQAKEILIKQYTTVNITDLSQQMHLDRKYLCKIFHSITGMTPKNYLIDIRLQNSTYLLSETELPMEEIASKCGYSSYSCFLQAFKKKYNLTPPEYRRIIQI